MLIVFTGAVCPLSGEDACGGIIFVSAHGDGTVDGSEVAPLGTIAAAQRKIRELKTAGGLPKGGVVVEILGGRYPLTEPIQLTAGDSGTAEAPIRH